MSDDRLARRGFLRTVPLAVLGGTGLGNRGRGVAGERERGTGRDPAEQQSTQNAPLQSFEQVSKFTPSAGAEYERLGGSVALSGEGTTAVVGARRDDTHGHRSGSAYVLDRDSAAGAWGQAATLTAEEPTAEEHFGAAVAVSDGGDTALVGAPQTDGPGGLDVGAAHVFRRVGAGWTHRATLTADDGDTADLFGTAVALSGDATTAIVGAGADDDPNGVAAGSAYVFEATTDGWTQSAKLTASDGGNSDLFGNAVTVSADGTTAVVGATGTPDCDGSDCLRGAAYVFESAEGDWEASATLAVTDGTVGDTFGQSVAVSVDGTTAVVGADSAGSAYVFESVGEEWTQRATLTTPDEDEDDVFGWSVAMSADGSAVLVGAKWDADLNGSHAGAAYVFERESGGWTHRTTLGAADGSPGDYFGWSVALSNDGTTAVASARNDYNENGDDAGAAYVFEAIPTAAFTVEPEPLTVGDSVTFDASATSSPNGDIVNYRWDLIGNGDSDATTTDPVLDHTYYRDGQHDVVLTVTDVAGKTGTAVESLFVGSGPDRPPAPPDRATKPRDPDADGIYEDLDGDGDVTLADVQLYFREIYQNRGHVYVQANRQYFDVTGDETISLDDVQTLFEERG